MKLYECEKCGHRNYATADDLAAERRRMIGDDAYGQVKSAQVRAYDQTEGVGALFRRFLAKLGS